MDFLPLSRCNQGCSICVSMSPPASLKQRRFLNCAVWAPAGERTQMIMIMRGLAMKLATGVQAGVTINLLWMHCPYCI